jgi:DNA-binding XRE family transcriptional regulator
MLGKQVSNAVHCRPMYPQASYHLVKVFRLRSGMSKMRLAKLAHLTPRIIHMIEQDHDYNPSRRTMIQLSNALGIPPSVLFFPQEEIDKRQMLSNMVIFCMDALGLGEEAVLQKLQSLSNMVEEPLPDETPPLRADVSENQEVCVGQ